MPSKRSRNNEPVRGKHAAPPASGAQPQRQAPTAPSRAASAARTPGHASSTQRPNGAQVSVGSAARSKKKRRVPLALKIVLTVVIVGAIVAGGLLVWNYLFRYDDAQDFQGQWKIEGTNSSIVITDSEIRLTDSVTFGYELNTFEKTLTYTYANFKGEGSYVFSPERDVLTITDVNTNPDQDQANESMRLLKVSNQAVGEPETANNNDTSDAQSYGADVIDGSMSASQAEKDETGSSATNKSKE